MKRKIYIYTDSASDFYFCPIKELEEKGKIQSYNLISMRIFRPLFKNILLSLGLIRGRQKEDFTIRDFLERSWAPIKLLFKKDIILGLEPYTPRVVYGLLLKFLGKNLIYYTSWPYWEGKNYPKRSFWIGKYLWQIFLRNTKVVGVTKVVSESVAQYQAKNFQIPHPVDIDRFYPAEKTEDKRKLKVLTVARLWPQKGIRDFIEIAKKKELANVIFTICGKGPMEEEVKKAVAEVDNLEYIPYNFNELGKLYRKSDIFILNSYRVHGGEELFGITILEAMSSGLPVIATDCVGPKEIIKDGVTGYIIPEKNQRELSKKILFLVENTKIRLKMGQEGRELVEKEYNLDKISKKWLKAIEL